MKTNKLFLLILPLLFAFSGTAQNKPSIWFELEFSKKISKNLKLEFNPELRLLDGFDMDSTHGFKMDSYILEGGLSYKLYKYLTVAGYYRYEDEYKAKYKKKTDVYEYRQQSLNRLAFDAKSGFELKRFDFKFRFRFTKGIGYNNTNSEFRYRTKISYDIISCKLSPYASIEAFHDLKNKEIDKMRYTAGLAYPISKTNEINLFYRIQDYYESKNFTGIKKESADIIGIGYSLKF